MKKTVKVILSATLALMMLAGMALTVFAETYSYGSPSTAVEVQGDGITVTDSNVKIETTDAAKLIGNGVAASQLAVVLTKDITAPSLPATLNFTVNGTAAPQKIYVFHYTDNAWKLEGSGEAPTVKVTVDKLSPFAVVVANYPSSTGDSSHVVLWGVLMAVAAAGAASLVIFDRKRKA